MEKIIEFFNSNPWLNFIFLALAVLGIILTVYTFIKSKRISKPTYESQKVNIISSSLSQLKDLKIKYKGKAIEELSVRQFVLYNAGKKAIRREDIAPRDKVRIKLKEGEILNYELKYKSKDINNITVDISENKGELYIDFDFLGYFDGLVIEIYYNSKEDDKVELLGTVIDSGNFIPFFKRFYQFKYMVFLSRFAKKPDSIFSLVLVLSLPILILIFPFMIYKFLELKKVMPDEFILRTEKNWLQQRV